MNMKIIERDNKSLPFKFNGIEWINGRGQLNEMT